MHSAGAILAFVWLAMIVIGIIGLIRGHIDWAHLRSRKAAALLLAASVPVLFISGALLPKKATTKDAATPATNHPVPVNSTGSAPTTAVPAVSATVTPPVTTTAAVTTTATSKATTTNQLCDEQQWPRAVPGDVIGKIASQLFSGALTCFDHVAALAPDGHDVLNDRVGSSDWRVVDISPSSGTLIARADPITMHVVPIDFFESSSTSHPCDWISMGEVSSISSHNVVHALPLGDHSNSIDWSCNYSTDSDGFLLTAEYKRPGSFAVDAASEYAVWAADPSIKIEAVKSLGQQAMCTTSKNGHDTTSLVVLLGDSEYIIMGAPRCDIATALAAKALPRLGT